MGTKNARTIKMNKAALDKLEAYINDQEDMGQLLVELGGLSDEEYAAGVHKLEDFRVKLEADPELVAEKIKELDETGTTKEVVDAEQGA